MVVEGDMAQRFAFTGRKRQGDTWPEGVYRGEYRLIPKAGSEERSMLSIDCEIMVQWLFGKRVQAPRRLPPHKWRRAVTLTIGQ